MGESPGYRDILRKELETRCGKNSRYSLRAFARDVVLKRLDRGIGAVLRDKLRRAVPALAPAAVAADAQHRQARRDLAERDVAAPRHARAAVSAPIIDRRIAARMGDVEHGGYF